MAASKASLNQTLDIMEKYVPKENLKALIDELTHVQGNNSFRVSMCQLRILWINRAVHRKELR